MKKITTIVFAIMATIGQLFSATTYLVQLGSGTPGSVTWRAADSGEMLVDLTVNAQTLTAWLTSKAFTSGDQVWIAAGTYNVSTGYSYPANLSIYGGFAGTETATSQRAKGNDAWSFTNATVIDCGLMTAAVLTGIATRAGFLVDGITITRNASTANGSFYVRDGVTVQNCKFTSNTGGAIAYYGPGSGQSSASITGCYFYNNSCSAGNGAGINSNTNTASSSMTINYCFFENNSNTHASTGGGGLRMSGSGANTVKNCIFKNNNGTAGGSAVSMNNAACTLTNCLIYGSTGSRALYLGGGTITNCTVVNNTFGGVYFAATTSGSNIYNSVFWGTDAASGSIASIASNANGVVKNCGYTSIQANLTGGASMIANNVVLPVTNTTGANAPYFVDPATNNWKLSNSSSLKSIGSNTWATANTTSDLIGTSRGSGYDIGAYQYSVSYLPVITFTDNLSNLTYGASTVTLTAISTSTTANAGAPVTYTSGNTEFVSISGKTLNVVGAGSTTVTAHQSANSFYDAAADASQNVTVNPKTLTLASASATNKVYDGTNSAAVSGILNGVINSDDVTCTTGTFASVNVGTGIAVNCILSGSKAANYTLTQPGLTANITAASSTFAGGNLNNSGLTDNQLVNTNLSISSGEFVINDTKTVHSLTIAPGAKLTHSSGTLTATNGIILESDASGTATLMDSYTEPTITATVKQHVTAGRNWYMSAPLNSTADYSVLDKGSSVVEYSETTGLWPAVTTGTLTRGKGYIQVATATQGTTGTVSFTGTTNSGNVPVSLTYTSGKGNGYNLVGNPYPSYLSWSAVVADNAAANMPTGTMWYRTISYNSKSAWTPNTVYSLNEIVYNDNRFYKVTTAGTSAAFGGPTGIGTGIEDGSVFWNYEGSIYIFATISASGVASPATVSNLIPPMQAFWVKSAGGTLTFKNAMRSHNTGGTNVLKVPKNSANEIKLIRLRVSNGASADEAVIYANTDASNGFDTYDAPKYFNLLGSIQPEIYTQVGNEKLVINAMNELSRGTEIPLGFATEKGNNFIISATEFRNFDSDMRVVLKDKQTISEFDISDGQSYSFNSDAVNSIDRFSLIFRAMGITTGIDNITNVQVFVNAANQITIIAPEKSNYAIYNAVGQKLTEGITTANRTIANGINGSGVYLVRVFENSRSNSTRVILNGNRKNSK